MEASRKSSDAARSTTGCNYRSSSVEDAVVDPLSHHAQSSGMLLHQHQQLIHPHQMDQGRAVPPPHYASLTSSSLNNNNHSSYSPAAAADDDDDDTKYHHLTAAASVLCQTHHHPYHNHARYHQHHHQQPAFHLDYCNAMPGGYGMTSRAAYRGQLDPAVSASYPTGEPRPDAGYWPPSCGVGARQSAAAADLDDPADVKPTLVGDPSSYLQVPAAGSYSARQQQQHGYVPAWYAASAGHGYSGWGVATGSELSTGGGYYPGCTPAYSDSTSPPMHHILRGVYNTLQVSDGRRADIARKRPTSRQ